MSKTNEIRMGFFKIFTAQVCKSDSPIYICTLFLRVRKKRYFRTSNWSVRLGVRTPDFHSGNTGSIPVQTTKNHLQLTLNQGVAFLLKDYSEL